MKDKRLLKILQVILMIVLVFSFYGCAAQKSSENYTAAAPKMAKEEVSSGTMMDNTAYDLKEESKAKGDSPSISTEVAYNRKMIKEGTLRLQTKEFKKSVEDLIEKVISLGGYVENSDIQGTEINNEYNRRRANLRVRIPQKHFDAFINNSSQFGNVVYSTSNTTDITSQYVDTEIRLKSLKIRHERLIVLLEKSGSLKDLFAIEQELGEVTYEIENLSGTLQQYDHLVDMSTITITIEEVYKIEEVKQVITFADKIEDTFKESIKGLISILEGLVLIGVALVPFLVILVPVIVIIMIIINKQRKKKVHTKIESSKEDKQDK